DLHVLPRHRLLVKPEVGERAAAVEVNDEPRDLAVPDVKHACSRGPDPAELKSALLAAPAAAKEYEHTLIVELPILVHHGAQLLPGVRQVEPSLRHSCHSGPPAGRRAVGDHE